MIAALNLTLLANSFLIAVAATLAAFVCGFAYALAMSASPPIIRRLLLGCAVATLALPSFLVTNSWIDLLAADGPLRKFFPLSIFSVGGTIWILSLIMWPMVAIVVSAAWPTIDRAHLEADPALRGLKLVRRLLWPTARSWALTGAVVVFALTLSQFAVPAILQVKVYSAEVWVQFNANLNAVAALQLSWPLVLVPLLVMALARRAKFPWPHGPADDVACIVRRQLGSSWVAGIMIVSTILGLLALVLPLSQLLAMPRTWSEFGPAARAGIPALMNSVAYAAMAAVTTLSLGLLLAPTRWLGWLWFFFFIPGLLLGIAAVDAFSSPGFDWISRTSAVAVCLLVIHYLALSRAICRDALHGIDPLLLDAGRLDGAAGATLLRRIIWPQIAPRVSAAGYLVYLLCLWDVETILMVIPPGGETLALRIFNLLHYGHNAQVNALCILLLLAALGPLIMFGVWCLMTRLVGRERREFIA